MATEAVIRASVLYAGIEIARERAASSRSPEEALAFIRQGPAGRNNFDYDAAFEVAGDQGWEVFSAATETHLAFRETMSALLERSRPVWVRVLPAGRRKVTASLPEDVLQCLEIAGLLGYEPEVVAWWDRLAALGRLWDEEARVAVGRDAEERAMAYEEARLAGTDLEPRWVSIEDNAAGYDIQTWRPGKADGATHQEHYVEVKGSTLAGIVHLSRGEWEFASTHSAAWELQIWLPAAAEPVAQGVETVAQHIPVNQGDGRWAEVEIPTDMLVPEDSFEVDTPLRQPILRADDLPMPVLVPNEA